MREGHERHVIINYSLLSDSVIESPSQFASNIFSEYKVENSLNHFFKRLITFPETKHTRLLSVITTGSYSYVRSRIRQFFRIFRTKRPTFPYFIIHVRIFCRIFVSKEAFSRFEAITSVRRGVRWLLQVRGPRIFHPALLLWGFIKRSWNVDRVISCFTYLPG